MLLVIAVRRFSERLVKGRHHASDITLDRSGDRDPQHECTLGQKVEDAGIHRPGGNEVQIQTDAHRKADRPVSAAEQAGGCDHLENQHESVETTTGQGEPWPAGVWSGPASIR